MQLSAFASPAFYADPYPMYEQLRARGELLPIAPGLSLSTSHALINELLCDRRMGRAYMQGIRLRYGEERSNALVFHTFERMMMLSNPPEHTRVRTLLMRAFNARQIAELSEWIRGISDELINGFIDAGQTDLMREFCLPLPVRVICRLLDVPYADAHVFSEASEWLVQSLELAPMSDGAITAANQACARLIDYFSAVVEERRLRPGQDLISVLLRAHESDGVMDEEELIANIILLFVAGHETTANMLGNSLVALHRHPEQWQRLIADPSLVPAAVNECLRYDSSVQLGVRVALEDVEIRGHRIPRGQIVYLMLGAANRDPAVFSEPATLNISRPAEQSRLLTFGGGVHYCLGMRLAVMELESGLSALLQRLPGLSLDGLDRLRWRHRNTLRGVESLEASWDAAKAAERRVAAGAAEH